MTRGQQVGIRLKEKQMDGGQGDWRRERACRGTVAVKRKDRMLYEMLFLKNAQKTKLGEGGGGG